MEQRPLNLNKKSEKPTRTIEELEAMLEFATLQIKRLKESGSQDKRLFQYLDDKKNQAIKEIGRLNGA